MTSVIPVQCSKLISLRQIWLKFVKILKFMNIHSGWQNFIYSAIFITACTFGHNKLMINTGEILFICTCIVSFAARAWSARAANDTTRAQINNIPSKSHVIIIIINKQGQMISRMRVLIIQAKWMTNSKSLQIIM